MLHAAAINQVAANAWTMSKPHNTGFVAPLCNSQKVGASDLVCLLQNIFQGSVYVFRSRFSLQGVGDVKVEMNVSAQAIK